METNAERGEEEARDAAAALLADGKDTGGGAGGGVGIGGVAGGGMGSSNAADKHNRSNGANGRLSLRSISGGILGAVRLGRTAGGNMASEKAILRKARDLRQWVVQPPIKSGSSDAESESDEMEGDEGTKDDAKRVRHYRLTYSNYSQEW